MDQADETKLKCFVKLFIILLKMQNDDYQAFIRILICGDLKTGKSQVLNRLADDDFIQEYNSTIGTDFKIGKAQLDENKPVKMQLWDSSGDERFQLIRINNFIFVTPN